MTTGHSGKVAGPTGPYRASRITRAGNVIVGVLIRAGLIPHCHLLTTRGRKSGRLRTQPVTVIEHEGRRWLVAPYGEVAWVLNAEAGLHPAFELTPLDGDPWSKGYA
ncbi:nitroreductase/quinone reductase family protein [Nonomuraea sp. NPDC059023]|uniref:nitroreductase/quinone reductase family protein n=1 Tax=unclassified Nonomuraea TaxID=2593643 RepID=UPI003676A137